MLFKKIFMLYEKQCRKHLSQASVNSLHLKLNSTPKLDAKEEKILNIYKNPDFFEVQQLFSMKDLFDARVHFGHKISSLNPNMKSYIFGSRLDYVIFDLNITARLLKQALNFAAHIAYQNGIILFISKNPSITLLVENTAKECSEYAVARDWKKGSFTDADRLHKGILRLPDLCIFINTIVENGEVHEGVIEAAKLCIPSIGIVDSNCNPNLIAYPIPGNDDSLSSISLYLDLFKKAILKGKSERKAQKKQDSTS